jgi:hypothetical protein
MHERARAVTAMPGRGHRFHWAGGQPMGVRMSLGRLGFLVGGAEHTPQFDDGRELFGDATPLNGKGTLDPSAGIAAEGFAALAKEDTNRDGVVNAADARFGALRLWRDLNQDGVSQAGELFTLGSQNITGIHVASTEVNQLRADGNLLNRTGTFTRGDGSSGVSGETSANFFFAQDTFNRQFTDTIPLAAGVSALPNMQGSGKVRDLWEAASQSLALMSALTRYSQATTRQAQLAQLDQLLDAWADTSGLAERIDDRIGSDLRVQYQGIGNVLRSAHYTMLCSSPNVRRPRRPAASALRSPAKSLSCPAGMMLARLKSSRSTKNWYRKGAVFKPWEWVGRMETMMQLGKAETFPQMNG